MMNKNQKILLVRLSVVLFITAATIFAVSNVKEYINRSEALQAMWQLSGVINEYRNKNDKLPPESYLEDVKKDLRGSARLGKVVYRDKWIGFPISSDTVLAYAKKDYHGLIVGDGCVVLRYNGKVEWLSQEDFEITMSLQWGRNEPRP